jgi:hypothetical protein
VPESRKAHWVALTEVPEPLRDPPRFPAILDIFAEDDLVHFGGEIGNVVERCYNFYAAYGAFWRPRRVLEIGVRRGYGAYSIAVGAGGLERYVGLDAELDLAGSNAGAAPLLQRAGIRSVDIRHVDTQLVFPSIAERFDLMHIDADHSMRGAFSDICNASVLLAPSGIMVIDDQSALSVAAATRAYLELTAAPARWFEVASLRRQLVICNLGAARRPGDAAIGFASLPDWAVLALGLDDAAGAVRTLAAGPLLSTSWKPFVALAASQLHRVASLLGISPAAGVPPHAALPALAHCVGLSAAIVEATRRRADATSFQAPVGGLNSHLDYVLARAPIAPPASVRDRPIARQPTLDPLGPQMLVLAREFAVHAVNFATEIGLQALLAR